MTDEPEIPMTRRSARAQRARDAESLRPDERREPSEVPPSADSRRSRRRRFVVWTVGVVVLVLAALGVTATLLFSQADSARQHLLDAFDEVTEVQRAVLAGEADAAAAASERLTSETSAAVSLTTSPLWSIGERLPGVGEDFAAARGVASIADRLAVDVVGPASTVSLDTFRPTDGRIDLEAVAELSPLIDRIGSGIEDASRAVADIDTDHLSAQVASGVATLSDALSRIEPVIDPLRDIAAVLPDALGAAGPRDYLLMFQGNSEARSLGGNAAVFIVVRAEGGAMSITQVVDSSNFAQPVDEPVIPLDPEAVAIYGDKIGRYTPDFTMVPDYPTAASILEGWWAQIGPADFDGVLSIDPVALSYLLRATGPLTLPTGDVLTSDNAVELLLNQVYFQYENPLDQNLFFGGAAASVFAAITGGNFAPDVLMAALAQAVEERRLMLQSDDLDEQRLIDGTPLSGVIGPDDDAQTTVGVFVNDNTGSKKSYYLDMSAALCRSETTVIGSTTLVSSLTAEEAARLPYYITGPYFPAADISTYVTIYGPSGSSLSNLLVDGVQVAPMATGQHLGRPVVKVGLLHHLDQTHRIDFAFAEDGSRPSGDLRLWHTPMSRATPTTVVDSCDG